MRFENYGPYDIYHTYTDVLEGPFNQYWNEVEEAEPGLSYANGCYIYAVRSSGGSPRPWYVGQAQRSFRQECFQPTKLLHYERVLKKHYSRGIPTLFFVARRVPSNKGFAKASVNNLSVIDQLEGMLIRMALKRNPELRNIRGTSFWSNVCVPGIMNSPKGSHSPATRRLKELFPNGG